MSNEIDRQSQEENNCLNLRYAVPANPKSSILNIPGAWADSSVFDSLNSFLGENNISSYSLDLPGHGDSDLPKGRESLKFVSINQYIESIYQAVQQILKETGQAPDWLIGHSMGAYLIMEYLVSQYNKIKTTDIKTEQANQENEEYLIKNAMLLSPPGPHGVALASCDYLIEHNGHGGFKSFLKAIFTADIGALMENEKIAENNLASGRIKNFAEMNNLRGPESFLAFMEMILDLRSFGKIRKNVQAGIFNIHILHGKGDRTFPFEGSRKLAKKLGIPEKNLHLFEDLCHYLQLDPEAAQVFQEMLKIINQNQVKNYSKTPV